MQLKSIYNAEKHSRGNSATHDSDNGLSFEEAKEKFSQKSVDNQVKSGYTSGNTTFDTGVVDGPEYTDTADYSGAPKSSSDLNTKDLRKRILHLMVYTKEIPKNSNKISYLESPFGYASGVKKQAQIIISLTLKMPIAQSSPSIQGRMKKLRIMTKRGRRVFFLLMIRR